MPALDAIDKAPKAHPNTIGRSVHLRIADPQLLAGGIGFVEAAFIDEADDAVREPVETGLGQVVSMWRYRWCGRHMNDAFTIPATPLVLPAAATRAGWFLPIFAITASSQATPGFPPARH